MRQSGVVAVLLVLALTAGCKRRAKPTTKAVPTAVAKDATSAAKPAPPAPPDDDDTPESQAAPETKTAPTAKAQSGATGFFRAYFVPPTDTTLTPYHQMASEHTRFKTALAKLGTVALPQNVPVVFKQCGKVNAFYTPSKHTISVCYEYMAKLHSIFKSQVGGGESDAQAKDDMLNAITFTTLHESGHALIGELKLGVSGGEEDAVDDFATIASVQLLKDPEIALDAAKRYELLASQRTKIDRLQFLDEHSLDEQRFANIYCSLYGSNPKTFQPLVGKLVTKQRAPKCPSEWEKKVRFWNNSLKPHVRGTTKAK